MAAKRRAEERLQKHIDPNRWCTA
ncbi:hypothetical protein [Bacillus paralicheniformis]|nr:hypothetical protein [Bacillus paralicheniformis]MDR9802723.1 hypothetical protein [Bacillus paralicheniformis]